MTGRKELPPRTTDMPARGSTMPMACGPMRCWVWAEPVEIGAAAVRGQDVVDAAAVSAWAGVVAGSMRNSRAKEATVSQRTRRMHLSSTTTHRHLTGRKGDGE